MYIVYLYISSVLKTGKWPIIICIVFDVLKTVVDCDYCNYSLK